MSTRVRPPRRRRPATALIVGLALGLALLTSGCGLGKDLYNTPLPGGADVGDHPLRITADFEDVVDLVPQSSVKVENIAVGRVDAIELNPDGRSARATLLVRGDVVLPKGTTARLQQTSLLGEKYVALIRPAETAANPAAPGSDAPGSDALGSGAHIPIADTSQVAEIEQVLGALSLVINGGGIAKFQDVSRELQQVSTGRPEEIRGFLRNMEAFVTSLDERKGALTAALDAVAELATTLDRDKDKISQALEGLSPGMRVLAEQRGQLVAMLKALDRLSDVSLRTLNASQEDMVEDMRLLEPILRELAAAGAALPNSLELLLTYPFPDSVLKAIRGDYLNVFATTAYSSLPDDCTAMGCAWPQPPDTGTLPPIDPFVDDDEESGTLGMLYPGSESEKAPANKNGKSAKKGATSPGGVASASPSGEPSSEESAEPSAGAGTPASPAPSLLPPTDSALPGLPTPSVQVPSTGATPRSSGSPGSPGSPGPSGSSESPPSPSSSSPASASSEETD